MNDFVARNNAVTISIQNKVKSNKKGNSIKKIKLGRINPNHCPIFFIFMHAKLGIYF